MLTINPQPITFKQCIENNDYISLRALLNQYRLNDKDTLYELAVTKCHIDCLKVLGEFDFKASTMACVTSILNGNLQCIEECIRNYYSTDLCLLPLIEIALHQKKYNAVKILRAYNVQWTPSCLKIILSDTDIDDEFFNYALEDGGDVFCLHKLSSLDLSEIIEKLSNKCVDNKDRLLKNMLKNMRMKRKRMRMKRKRMKWKRMKWKRKKRMKWSKRFKRKISKKNTMIHQT